MCSWKLFPKRAKQRGGPIQKSQQRCKVWSSLHKIKENTDCTSHNWHVFSKAHPKESKMKRRRGCRIQKPHQWCEVWSPLHKIKENEDHTSHHWHVFSHAHPEESKMKRRRGCRIQKTHQWCEVWPSLHKIKRNSDHTSHHWRVFSSTHPNELLQANRPIDRSIEDVKYRSHINDVRYGLPCINQWKLETTPVIIGMNSRTLIPKSTTEIKWEVCYYYHHYLP